MQLDLVTLNGRGMPRVDLCIVGAGPAGLTLASELAGTPLTVLVLDSGAETADADVLALNDGDVVGDEYAGLRETRHRRLGGTTWLWNTPVRGEPGARYAPLEPLDLERREPLCVSGWPLDYSELCSYYERAQSLCGLGPFAYEATRETAFGASWQALGSANLVPHLYQLGSRDALVAPKLRVLRASDNILLCAHVTALRLLPPDGRRRVPALEVRPRGGAVRRVEARCFVLAGGAVENARLLLASGGEPAGLGNESDWVGRGFMEHPRDDALRLVPRRGRAYRALRDLDVQVAPDGRSRLGRLALADDVLRTAALPNVAITLLARPRRLLHAARARLARVAHRLPPALLPDGGYGWSRHPAPRQAYAGLAVRLLLEQRPHRENRIRLGRALDAHDVPRAELHWRWRPAEQEQLQRLRRIVARELEALALGAVVTEDTGRGPDPNAHHHAGTTRMSARPRDGVVDADGRVHTLDNVYAAGASVLPTSGHANPTLTIVALAARLADHLRARL